MKTDPEYPEMLFGGADPLQARRPGKQRRLLGRKYEKAAQVDYFTQILKEHLEEHYPCEMMRLEDMQVRARIAYKESIRPDVPIADALSNALRYLLFGFETSGIERLKSEIWIQGYYTQEKGRHIELPEVALQIFAGELSLLCREFLAHYPTTKDREALIACSGIREIVGEYLKCRWGV